MTKVFPGGTIGILGGGQLARMLSLEARRMGYRVAVLDPTSGGPAAQVADLQVTGAFDDADAAQELAQHSDVITLDTEHIPATLLDRLEATKPVRPSARILRIIQDRLEQRRFLQARGAPQPRHAPVDDPDSLRAAAAAVGFPAVLKTRRSGYDGKGQARVASAGELTGAWERIGRAPAVLESFVDFEREVSVLLARDLEGNVCFYPVTENEHRRHILHTSRAPARISAELASEAQALGGGIAASLGHVGVMAVELFVTRGGELLVNEIAPRTHNSGHYTFGACATSQFEQHVRAICGLPLADPSLFRPAVMLNLLGDLWSEGPPDWRCVLAEPTAHLHVYGKERAWPGRKMGHLLIVDDTAEHAYATAQALDARLKSGAP